MMSNLVVITFSRRVLDRRHIIEIFDYIDIINLFLEVKRVDVDL